MFNPEEILKLSKQRLKEAEILFQNGLYDGAYYLAGYSVELSLKAKICERLGLPHLFNESDGSTNSIKGISEIRKTLKTHNLQILLIISGLKPKFDEAKGSILSIAKINSLLINEWNENARYQPCGHVTAKDIETLITHLTSTENLFVWIAQN